MPKTFIFMNQYDSSVNELIDTVLAHTGDADYSSSSLLWIIGRALRNNFSRARRPRRQTITCKERIPCFSNDCCGANRCFKEDL